MQETNYKAIFGTLKDETNDKAVSETLKDETNDKAVSGTLKDETNDKAVWGTLKDETIYKAILGVLEDKTLYRLSDFYKVFGDGTRLKILFALFDKEVCVCDLADILNMTVSAVSHQLRILKNASLVKFRKDGKASYYSLADRHVETIVLTGLEHIKE